MIKLNDGAYVCQFHKNIYLQRKYTKHFWKSEIILKIHFCKSGFFLLLAQRVLKSLHGIGLGLLGNLDIRLHGLVVGVAGPLHHHLGRDTAGEGDTDEGTPGGMGTYQVALGKLQCLCFLNL